MNPLIVIGIITITPVVLILLLRSKVAVVFLSLCAGSILATFVGQTATEFMQIFIRNPNEVIESIVQLILLLLPALLSIIFMRRSANGANVVFNIFPASLTGIVMLLLVVPQLPSGLQNSIMQTNIWEQLVNYQAVLVGSAVFISMVQVWSGNRGARRKKGKH